MSVTVLGIRHHGPGSARSVVAALDHLRPDAVLIEGPADADALVPWVADPDLAPPVALLAHVVGEPGRASFWPFAVFSPEWQALRWANLHKVPVRFCDLPSTAVLAPSRDHARERGRSRTDPIAVLASTAGYDDPERWWEDMVEQQFGEHDPFPALLEAMTAVREGAADHDDPREERREAYMRQVIRQTAKQADRIAVVCGAWHAPVLAGKLPPAGHDAAILKGLPKVRTTMSWVPWSHSRLAYASGYGAGIPSPGWYHHLWTAPDRPLIRWLTKVAAVLRLEDLAVSSAHVIEAVRLAEALSALRLRPLAGLAEVTDATRSVLCEGNEAAVRLVTDRLVVGEALGAVPESAPAPPLATDLNARAKKLRLKVEAGVKPLDLDLRRELDRNRSAFLHQLRLLDVEWGTPRESEIQGTGTFRESWSLQWDPGLAVSVVEASLWGTTVAGAAAARVVDRAKKEGLVEVTAAVEQCLLSDLADALPPLLSTLDERAAADLDVLHLMDALPALVRALRYGDVRGTDTSSLGRVADALAVRVTAALPPAAHGLDDDAAAELKQRIDTVHDALALRSRLPDGETPRERWLDVLAQIADREDDVHGLIAGGVTRHLLDAGRLDPPAAARKMQRALSRAVPPGAKAAWVEGFLGDGGMLLAHDPVLIGMLDAWVADLKDGDFTDVLPLLRRTFSTFQPAERRIIGERVRRAGGPAPAATAPDVDDARGLPAARTAARILTSSRDHGKGDSGTFSMITGEGVRRE